MAYKLFNSLSRSNHEEATIDKALSSLSQYGMGFIKGGFILWEKMIWGTSLAG